MGGRGPLGTSTNSPRVDTGTTALTPNKPPAPIDSSTATIANRPKIPPFIIHLDLKELIEIDNPREGRIRHADTGKYIPVLLKGKVMHADPERPKAVLAIVRNKFKPLSDLVQIRLGTTTGSDRFLKVHFGWPLAPVGGKPVVHKVHGTAFDPAYVGTGADALSRTRLKSFKPLKGDPEKGVTAYIFEGAIGHVILEFFPGKSVNVNNIFATSIVHELGHNLGLTHTLSPKDIMFVYANRPVNEQRQWMILAEKGSLAFSATQLASIRKLLRSAAGIKP